MAAVVGVKIGCTCACIATSKDGKTDVVANDAGERVTPALVAFIGNEKTVGLPAKQGLIRNAKNTISGCMRLVGKRWEDLQPCECHSACTVLQKDGYPYYEVEIDSKKKHVSPKEATAVLFKKMYETAQSSTHGGVKDVVLAVPADFSDNQRTVVREAAEESGFHVLRLINEPIAALLAYDIGQENKNLDCTALVFGFGGSTTSATLVAVTCGMYRIVTMETLSNFGGQNIDEILVKHLESEFKRQYKCDPSTNMRAMAKLRAAAESCKHVLSSRDSATCSVESLHEGIDFQCKLTRARLESLAAGVFQQCLTPVQKVLEKAKLKTEDIDKVILTGGSAKIPKVQQLLRDTFVDKELCCQISPDEVISYGAAVEASLLQGQSEEKIDKASEATEIECTSRSICMSVTEDTSYLRVVLPRLTPIPVRRSETFSTSTDNQESVCLCIYETDEDTNCATSPILVAKVVLDDLPPKPAGELNITVSFHIRRDGSLHVHMMEKTSSRTADVTVEAS